MRRLALCLAVLAAACVLPVTESTDASGLKEALRIATERAVQSTSRTNGFLDNPRIRIELPGALGKMASALRVVGMGAQVDELELAMNRAAERAVGEATPVFVDAITKMTLQDAAGIVTGGDTLAQDFSVSRTPVTAATRAGEVAAEAVAGHEARAK